MAGKTEGGENTESIFDATLNVAKSQYLCGSKALFHFSTGPHLVLCGLGDWVIRAKRLWLKSPNHPLTRSLNYFPISSKKRMMLSVPR